MLTYDMLNTNMGTFKERLNTSVPCDIQLDPITGIDCYYTDGTAVNAVGKIIFRVEGKYYTTYIYPDGNIYGNLDSRARGVLTDFLKGLV